LRPALAIPLLLLMALPNLARSAPPGISPSATTDRNEARWAELEAQARVTDGDYEGAVQAQKQADAARTKADQQETLARGTVRRP
jgi:hypothetical protein